MATSAVVQAVTDVNAQNIVFSEKKSPQLFDGDDKKESADSSGSSDSNITPKDFYWDQIMFYLVSAILGLSFLDISVEFFRGSVVQCYTPDLPRDQVSYLNNYCYSSLPDSQYYLIFILISALLIIAPHYMWESFFKRHFDFFFDLVKKLNRLRDTKTGEYNPLNFELVKKLENKFSKFNTWIYRLYVVKLLTQLVISTIVLLANALYFQDDDFEETFVCPHSISLINTTQWPLDKDVTCVYNSLSLLKFLRLAAFILISLSIAFLICGLFWGIIRHPNELGAKEIASFCDVSNLPPEEHNFPSMRSIVINIFTCNKQKNLQPRADSGINKEFYVDDDENLESSGRCSGFCEAIKQLFHPCITSDLDFLVLRLYFADSGHGQVFKDIQIQKEIQHELSKDHELLYLLKRVQADHYQKGIDKIRAKLDKRFKQQQQQLNEEESEEESEDDEEWDRVADLKRFLFEAGLEVAGPAKNPEQEVYSKFQHEMGVDTADWSYSALRSVIYGFLKFGPDNKFAVDISFGTPTGYSLVLARAFDFAATFHFNKYYKNSKEVCRARAYQAGYRTVTFQEDIYSQEASKIIASEEPLVQMLNETPLGRSIDLVVIGPINDRSKIVTANLLIEKLYDRKVVFKKNSLLIAIRPLKIGSKTRTDYFVEYTPPESIFKDINDEVEKKLAEHKINVYSVSPLGDVKLMQAPSTQSETMKKAETSPTADVRRRRTSRTPSRRSLHRRGTLSRMRSLIERPCPNEFPCGIVVHCNDLECIFEFKLYRYIGRYYVDNQAPTPQLSTHSVIPEQPTNEDTNQQHDAEMLIDLPNITNSEQVEAEITSPVIPSVLQSPLQPSQSASHIDVLEAISSDNKLADSARSAPSLINNPNDLVPALPFLNASMPLAKTSPTNQNYPEGDTEEEKHPAVFKFERTIL